MRAAQPQGVAGRGPDDDDVVPIGEPDDDDYDVDDDIDEEDEDDDDDPIVVGQEGLLAHDPLSVL